MQPTTLSRVNSQSTSGRTLVGSDYGAFSPWDSMASPIIQTPDQKQWIDLDLLNPKFLKGLREYAPSTKDERESKLGKGAAKIKAWARQSKAGIDIRLRRKINAEKDEITDIQLVPDGYGPYSMQEFEKPPIVQELPASGSITELADTSVATELDATQSGQPSRSSTGSTVGEPLPRYEREPEISSPAPANSARLSLGGDAAPFDYEQGERVRDVSPVRSLSTGHRPSVSQSSIVATPTRGLSLREAAESPSASRDAKEEPNAYATSLQADLEQAKKNLNEERELSQSLQAIIQALNEDDSQQEASSVKVSGSETTGAVARSRLDRLKVAKRTTYETETEYEPPSPARRQRKPAGNTGRKKSTTFTKQRMLARSLPVSSANVSDTSDDELDAAAGTLIRKQTLPKRVPAAAGAEAVWRSLIRMQTILLGPDHPLTVQAKADLRVNKSRDFLGPMTDLAALQQSRTVAVRDFGSEHPWVAAFCEDLQKLASLAQPTHIDQTGEGNNTLSGKIDVTGPNLNTTDSLKPPELVVTEESPASFPHAKNFLQRIDTSVQGEAAEKEPSPVVGGVEIDSQLDLIWNNGRLPHQPQKNHIAFLRLGLAAVSRVTWNGLQWIQRNYGPEQPVEPGKTRVRWTCSCGEKLHDDFVEKRPGAARALEAYLNRPRSAALSPRPAAILQTRPNNGSSPNTIGSSPGGRSFSSSFGAPPSSQTSLSNNSLPYGGSWGNGDDSKMQQTWSSMPNQMPYSPTYEPPWLLAVANEDNFTPKVTHLDMSRHKIHSDKDLANSQESGYLCNRVMHGIVHFGTSYAGEKRL